DLTRIRVLHHRPAPRVRELRLVEGNSRLRSHSSTASRRYRVVRPILVGGGPSPLRAMRSIVRVLRRNCLAGVSNPERSKGEREPAAEIPSAARDLRMVSAEGIEPSTY